ncbi:ABC transporter ATP-binding protein [Hymenobacter koreensis]|uniref:ABC transporter ATP-binding protein n=1 Tax=Hymenobacter koreensis TaxID=1084523 RepID=A0ABP8J2F1_9BACT
MIRIEGLTKKFGKTEALRGVSVQLEAGRVVVIMGPNASGKSTLLKCILGVVQPSGGDIRVLGQPIAGQWQYRADIGYMPQLNHLPENLTTAQLFDMIRAVRQPRPGQALDYELYEQYALRDWQNKRLGTLSGGTRQKINAALAFLFAPRIIVLDEPSVGLDPVAVEILKAKIRKCRAQGRLVLLTSHLFAEAEELGDDLLYLRDGQVQLDTPIADFLELTQQATLGAAVLAYYHRPSATSVTR